MAYLLLTLTVLFWAGNFVVAKLIHADLPPILLAFSRWALAWVLILPFWIPKARKQWPLIKQHWKILALLGIVGVASFNTLIYTGLQSTTATNAALLQSIIPVLILLICALVLSEPVSGRQWCGVLASMAGVALLISHGEPERLLELQIGTGDLWISAAVVSWAAYSVLLRYKPAELGGFVMFGCTVSVAIVGLLPLVVWEWHQLDQTVQWSTEVLAVIGYVALFPSILSYIFWNRGVAELGAARAGLFIHLLPLFGIGLSVMILGESVYLYHLVGMCLVFSGIYLATASTQRSREQAEAARRETPGHSS